MSHAALALVTVLILTALVFGVVTLARRRGPENQYRREMYRLHSQRNPNFKRTPHAKSPHIVGVRNR